MAQREDYNEEDTPTQALMKVLEAFGEAEPEGVIVIWEDKVYVNVTRSRLTYTNAIGLLEYVKGRYLRKMLEQD